MSVSNLIRQVSVALFAVIALVGVPALSGCSKGPASPHSITLTLIRHGESEANADGVIDTLVPGPGLTPLGTEQAGELVQRLAGEHYDAVYASNMSRAIETAAPMAEALGTNLHVLPALREISAGWFEGRPESWADTTYLLAPIGWVHGARSFTVPGSVDGDNFNARFTGAVEEVYESGKRNPVLFSHAASITAWTVMNVSNPSEEIVLSHPLPNAGVVVLEGNPFTGWRLVDWDGHRV